MKELDKSMYFGANPGILEKAKILRKNMTLSEKILWEKVKCNQICGMKFRRQHPINMFIADFYCHAVRLVIEIDGEIHIQKKDYDDGRSAEMEKYYIKVIRFKNSEIESNIEEVINIITNEVKKRIQSPPWGI